jgi:hypothetical protein
MVMENLARTNEEIANNIAKDWKMTYLAMENDGGTYDVDSFDDCYGAALEALQWKDKQLKKQEQQLIDKACEWLKNNINDYYTTNEFEQWFDEMFEDFKQAMEVK